MPAPTPLDRRLYELTGWRVPSPFEPVPLLLYHRLDLPLPKPAVIYYHGVVQRKEVYLDTHPMARRLADAGFVVALPDAPGHGERPAGARLIERLRASLPREFCADIEQAGDEAPALLDWLAARPEVDGTRLGVLGVSMGGFTAAVVAARARVRLRAAVCIAGCANLPHCMATTDSIAPGKWGPLDRALDGETRDRIARVDPLGYPERLAPLPLLLLHGEQDTWNPCVTSQQFAGALQPHYRAAPEQLRLVLVSNAPHWPPSPAMVDEAITWLCRHVAP
jgi:dienelactone hydrolase